MTRSEIARIARELRDGLDIIETPLYRVCKRLQINIYFRLLPYKVNAVTIRASVFNDSFVCVVNRHSNLGRLRFTIAHEIGHVALGHFYHADDVIMPHMKSNQHNRLDQEANAFATELLMPSDIIKPQLDNGVNIDVLRKTFKVSRQCMAIRVKELTM